MKTRAQLERQEMRAQNDLMHQGDALVTALAALHTDGDESAWMADVVDLFDGVPASVFRDLDEKPGHWGYERNGAEWHWKLRRTRNHPAHGRELFDALT